MIDTLKYIIIVVVVLILALPLAAYKIIFTILKYIVMVVVVLVLALPIAFYNCYILEYFDKKRRCKGELHTKP